MEDWFKAFPLTVASGFCSLSALLVSSDMAWFQCNDRPIWKVWLTFTVSLDCDFVAKFCVHVIVRFANGGHRNLSPLGVSQQQRESIAGIRISSSILKCLGHQGREAGQDGDGNEQKVESFHKVFLLTGYSSLLVDTNTRCSEIVEHFLICNT